MPGVEGEMTIYRGRGAETRAAGAVRTQDAPELDLASVTEIDTAGAAAAAAGRARGRAPRQAPRTALRPARPCWTRSRCSRLIGDADHGQSPREHRLSTRPRRACKPSSPKAANCSSEMETRAAGGQDADGLDAVNAIFRAAHTIKGSAGLFGLDPRRGVHACGRERAGRGARRRHRSHDELVALLLACRDHIGALIDAVGRRHGWTATPHLAAAGAPLLARAADLPGTDREPAAPARRRRPRTRASAPLAHLAALRRARCCATAWTRCRSSATWASSARITGIATLARRLPDADDIRSGVVLPGLRDRASPASADKAHDRRRVRLRARRLRDAHPAAAEPHRRIRPPDPASCPRSRRVWARSWSRCGSVTAHELEAALAAQARPSAERPAASAPSWSSRARCSRRWSRPPGASRSRRRERRGRKAVRCASTPTSSTT